MSQKRELSWHELKTSYKPSDFSFSTTSEIVGSEGIIGQERAVETLHFGLKLNAPGYNIFICSDEGKDKLKYITHLLQQEAKSRPIPQDLCYIHNFKKPDQPQLVALRAGDGKKYQDDMNELILFLMQELPAKLQGPAALKKKQAIYIQFDKQKEEYFQKLHEAAKQKGFLMDVLNEGIAFLPLSKNQEALSKSEYELLTDTEKKKLELNLAELYQMAEDILTQLHLAEKVYKHSLEDINGEIALEEIGYMIKYLKDKYQLYPRIQKQLDAISEDIVKNISLFVSEHDEGASGLKGIFPWAKEKELEKLVKKYGVNLLVDNSHLKHAPIIIGDTLSKSELVGRINIETEGNIIYSDFMSIKPGLFHYAQGGWLVVFAKDLFDSRGSWEALKRVLKTECIDFDTMEETPLAGYIGIKPQKLKNHVKVILLGSEEVYHILFRHDKDFKDLFKVKVEFEEETDNNNENICKLASIIKGVCDKEHLKPVSIEGILKIAEYGSRLVQDPKKLTSNIQILCDLVREANIYAHECISSKDIERAIQRKQQTKNRMERRIDQKIKNQTYLIDTEGEKVGQINGLAIYDLGDDSFAKPIRITATTYKGLTGIIDIEKEAALSGNIHTKGINIITGFLGYHFAQDRTLSLSARICFEQSYSEVDGDSASSAELYAILSSLADIPIKQNIAVTGSVNQFGQIQPVGSINEKIEGFYRTCKQKGLKGNEGVLIPYQNKDQLMLDDEVVEAVKKGLFHIYVVSYVQEGIEIMTGRKYEEIEKRVIEKLDRFNRVDIKDKSV